MGRPGFDKEFRGKPMDGLALRTNGSSISTGILSGSVVCGGLEAPAVDRVLSMLTIKTFAPKQTIFYEEDPAEHVYELIEGVLKLYKLMPDGRRQITGFAYPGDYIGLSWHGCYVYTTEAITPAKLTRYPRTKFERLADEIPAIGARLLSLANTELVSAQTKILWLGRKTATEKVTSFLLWLSDLNQERGKDPEWLDLPMQRGDIADYLGLTKETVSRTFSHLQRIGAIKQVGSHRLIKCNLDQMMEIAECDDGRTGY
jgi:CRP/FNR family transcriptional regulator